MAADTSCPCPLDIADQRFPGLSVSGRLCDGALLLGSLGLDMARHVLARHPDRVYRLMARIPMTLRLMSYMILWLWWLVAGAFIGAVIGVMAGVLLALIA